MTYREVELGETACTVCDEIVPIKYSARVGIGGKLPIWVHGPRGNRCPGGGIPGTGWLVASRLPQWDGLTDLDKGAALMHAWKVHWEASPAYARENYPVRYFDHPELLALDIAVQCRHARAVTSGHNRAFDALGHDERQRLYDLALREEEVRRGNSGLSVDSSGNAQLSIDGSADVAVERVS